MAVTDVLNESYELGPIRPPSESFSLVLKFIWNPASNLTPGANVNVLKKFIEFVVTFFNGEN